MNEISTARGTRFRSFPEWGLRSAGWRGPALALLLAGCGRAPRPATVERGWTAMNTFASVVLPAHDARDPDAAAALVRAAIGEVEAELSYFRPTSLVSRVNAAAGAAQLFPLTEHARAVFALSQTMHALSGGAFDPTVGPLMRAWGFRGANRLAAPPDHTQLEQLRARSGWQRVEWGTAGARLTVPGMALDFGAIAKGYAVDVAFERLRTAGYTHFMVNLGGNLRCAGVPRMEREGWHVAVRDPFLPHGEGRIGTKPLTAGRATATSGHYERFVEIGGRRYAHVIDPRTGWPAAGLAQVTVVADTAAVADALSTALFVLGMEQGAELIRRHGGAEAVFVPDPPPGSVARAWATEGFLETFRVAPDWQGRVERLPP